MIYKIAGADAEKDAALMSDLTQNGKYEITDEMKAELADFYGNYATEAETAAQIKKMYEDCGYIMDTHTAVASCVYDKYVEDHKDKTKTVIASTASPYKFTRSVMNAIDPAYDAKGDFELVDELNRLSNVAIPNAIEEIRTAPILHNRVCDGNKMKETVCDILGLSE